MSGGSFDYAYWKVDEFADTLRNYIDANDTKDKDGWSYNLPAEVIAKLTPLVREASILARKMKEAEWLYSGDTGPDTFLQRMSEIEKS